MSMSSIQENVPVELVTSNTKSSTDEDKSLPPTPDGSGLPVNFSEVAPGIYRSSYPQLPHFEELKALKLKTILILVDNDRPADYEEFMETNGINHVKVHIKANKQADVYTPPGTVIEALKVIMDRANHPVLIHCNKGKHRTGCISACFRKVCGWTLSSCLEEYTTFSAPKTRDLDKAFITRFDEAPVKALALEQGYIGGAYRALPTPANSNASEKDGRSQSP